jgi:magnesium-transporting ATPase (P-type)
VRPRLTDVPMSGPESRVPATAWHTFSVEQVLEAERVSAQRGLSSAEAEARAAQSGPNKPAAARAEPRWSIGLGYSNPAEGLMERRPRSPSQPILSRGVLSWLVWVGLVMAVGTLSVVSWAQQADTLTIARTMGVVVFSLLNLFFSIEAKDERESAFSLGTFSDRTFILTAGVSLFLLVMATVLGPCQAILKTTELDVYKWLLCVAVALSIVVVSEIRKAVLRRTAAKAAPVGRRLPGS